MIKIVIALVVLVSLGLCIAALTLVSELVLYWTISYRNKKTKKNKGEDSFNLEDLPPYSE